MQRRNISHERETEAHVNYFLERIEYWKGLSGLWSVGCFAQGRRLAPAPGEGRSEGFEYLAQAEKKRGR